MGKWVYCGSVMGEVGKPIYTGREDEAKMREIMNQHNADCDAYEAQIDELQRRLALAGNALVPVPDGEPCERGRCCHDHCLYDGVVLSDNWDERPTNIITGKRHDIPWDAIVQPVRLVPLAELIDQKGCGVSDTR